MREVGEGTEEEEGDCDDAEPGLLGSLELLELPGLLESLGLANNEPARSELAMQKAMVRGNNLCFILFPFFVCFSPT
jgi:hypothetical protein